MHKSIIRLLTAGSILGICAKTAMAEDQEFQRVLDSFGEMITVAGNGAADDDNDWLPSYEGGPGTAADLSRPHMTVADKDGNLYIADKESNAIRKVSLDGTIHTIAGTGVQGFNGDGPALEVQLAQPNGIYRLKNGTFLILDLFNQRIRKLKDGTITTVLHDDSMALGRGLWGSEDEKLVYYASGSEVRRWRKDEGVDTYANGFSALGNFAMDPQGRLVVTDRGAHTVVRIESDGTQTIIAGNGLTSGGGSGSHATQTGLNEVRGIAYLPSGGYFLCTHRDSQVWYVDTEGIIHLLIDGDRDDDTHSGDGQLLSVPGKKISEPRAVSLSPGGDLIITENDRGYIRVIEQKDKKPHVLDSGTNSLRFRSVPGVSYQLEYSLMLMDWSPSSENKANTRVTEMTWNADDASAYFVRVKHLGLR